MAVVNTKSTQITNEDATPVVLNKTYVTGGRLYEDTATLEIAAADSDTSVYRFVRVFSSDRISSVEVACDAITGGTSFDIGVFDIADNGGAVVDADIFASAVDLSSALAWTDKTYEADATKIDVCDAQLWSRLGLTADPKKWYDICLYANTVGTAAGTVSLRVRRVKGA